MRRDGSARPAIAALLVYCASIVAANWLVRNVGQVVLPDGNHLVPVGFGLLAPSGAFAAGVTFVARDVVQRAAGRRWALAAVAVGTVVSVLVSPRLAVASGSAFLFSELVDFAVYTPLQERRFVIAVVLSGIAGSVVDSVLFLGLAGIPLAVALPGMLLAKVWVQLLAAPVAGWLRGRIPRPAGAGA